MITIHNFARGARGLRVAWQCEEMGLPYRVQVHPFPTPPSYRALNPLGSVPYLEDDATGAAMGESVAMMLHLAHRYGPTSLLPADANTHARALQWTVFSEATLGAALGPLMTARFMAPEGEKQNWSVRASGARVEQALAHLSDSLGEGPWLLGEAFSLADIAISTALSMWQGALDGVLTERLAAYQSRATAREAYQRARGAG